MTIDELQIIKLALENDISWQKTNQDLSKPAFKKWLDDSELLLKKITLDLSYKLARKQYIEQSQRSWGY